MTHDEMSIEQLASLAAEFSEHYGADNNRFNLIQGFLDRRRAARDAILDLAEQLEGEGMVVVPEADWRQAVISWSIHAGRNGSLVPAPNHAETE